MCYFLATKHNQLGIIISYDSFEVLSVFNFLYGIEALDSLVVITTSGMRHMWTVFT